MGRLLREIEIGLWYEAADESGRFEVVAMDDTSHTIEIQYIDGTVGEIDYEAWSQLGATDSAPPDDDSGAFDTEPPDHDAHDMLQGAMFMGSWDERSPDIEQIGLHDTLL